MPAQHAVAVGPSTRAMLGHMRPNRPSGGSHGLPVPYGTGGAMLVGSSPAQAVHESLPGASMSSVQVVADGMDRFEADGDVNPMVEIERLRESLARAEERRRLEAVLFEERARRVEADLEHCRAEGALLSRLCEEREALVGTLRAELTEAQGERDAYQAELAEARFELERRFAAAGAPMATGGPARTGTSPAMRQSSGPPTATLPERGISEPSGVTRLGSGPDSRGGPWPPVATAATAAMAAAVAHAAQADASGPPDSSGGAHPARGAASARGAAPNRALGGSGAGPTRQGSGGQPLGATMPHSHNSGGFQPKHLGPRPNSLPPDRHEPRSGGSRGGNGSSMGHNGSHSSGVGDSEAGRDVQEEPSGPPGQAGHGIGSAVVRTPSKAGNGKGRRSPEKPVEICISVPRALTPDELREMAETQEPPPVAAVPPARSLRSLPQTPHSVTMPTAHQAVVNRQASAPYAPAAAPTSPNATDQWPCDPRWTGPGAAPPPPVRIVAAQQQSGAPKPGSGSATVPTATGLAMTDATTRAVVATAATPPSTTASVRPAISQARLGMAVRR